MVCGAARRKDNREIRFRFVGSWRSCWGCRARPTKAILQICSVGSPTSVKYGDGKGGYCYSSAILGIEEVRALYGTLGAWLADAAGSHAHCGDSKAPSGFGER